MAINLNTYKTPRSPVISFAAIDDPNSWPKADSSKCCIFEAINTVGRARFGSEWTGTELLALNWDVQPKEAEAQRLANLHAARLIPQAPAPPVSIARASFGQVSSVGRKLVASDHHVVARAMQNAEINYALLVEQEQLIWDVNAGTLSRLTWVANWLGQRCRDEDLVSFARIRLVGKLWPMHSWEWNKENVLLDIVSGGGPRRAFLEVDALNLLESYIFFDRAKLDEALSTFAHAPMQVTGIDLGQMSPYLRFAVALARTHDLSSTDKCLTVKARERLIRNAWQEGMPGVPISNSQVEHLAAVLGWPNAAVISKALGSKPIK